MPNLSLSACLAVVFGLLSAPWSTAIGDVRSDMVLAIEPVATPGTAQTSPPAAPKLPQIRFTTYVRGPVEREEMSVGSPFPYHLTALVMSDQKRYVEMDSALKIYTSRPLDEAPPDLLGLANFQSLGERRTAGADQEGKIAVFYTVKDLGLDIAPTARQRGRHYTLETHRIASGAAGASDTTTVSEVWASLDLKRPDNPERTDPARSWTTAGGAKITLQLAGDVDAYGRIAATLPVEVKTTLGGGAQFHIVQIGSSTAAQDATLFTIPAGYKQLSPADYVQAEQNAIIDTIAGPQPKLKGSANNAK